MPRRHFLLVSDDDWSHATCVTDLLIGYRKAGVPVEAHIFTRGGHGYNMGYRSDLRTIKHWPARMTDWIADNFILDPAGQRITSLNGRRTPATNSSASVGWSDKSKNNKVDNTLSFRKARTFIDGAT